MPSLINCLLQVLWNNIIPVKVGVVTSVEVLLIIRLVSGSVN